MKKLKTLIALGAILAPSAISARSLNADEAKQIAADFIQQKGNIFRQSRSSALTSPCLTLVFPNEKISRSTTPAYYIFNISDNNGYVIVSGDDSFNEILGYSDSGNYQTDRTNPAVEFWLNCMAKEMSTPPGKEKKQSRGSVTMTDVAPLLKTTWNQGEPYNNDCYVSSYRPTLGKQEHAPTGCVATAMAQIMNYHKWPQSYKGFEYEWDLMLPSYNGTESAESIDQVAKLMNHCGIAVGMSYGASASGASSYRIAPAFVNDFGYDGSKIEMLEYNAIGKERMHTLLNTELKEGRPIMVGGEYPGSSMGHQFIFDGCTSDGFFHVNWGWGGYLDGYYRITSLRPEDFSTGGSVEGYSFNVSMITGIQPNKGTDPASGLRAKIVAMGDLRMVGVNEPDTLSRKYYSYFEPSFITTNAQRTGFMNTGSTSFTGYGDYIQTKWTNLSTGEVSIKGEKYYVKGIDPGYYTSEISFFNKGFSIDLVAGEKYEVSLVYHLAEEDKDSYHDVEFGVGRRSSVILERFGDSLRYIHTPLPAIIKAELPALGDRMIIKANQVFSTSFTNTSDREYVGEAKWIFKDAEGNIVNNTTDYVMLDLMPDEKITEDFTLYNLGNAKPGKYTVGIYDCHGNLISEPKDVELYEYIVELNETNFPDPIFRNYISSKYDSDRDGQLSAAELINANAIQVDNLGIEDFKGCELLSNLSFVEIIDEKCAKIDFSACDGPFNYLAIYGTPLETITLGNRKELIYCYLYSNKLKDLDLTGCPNVKYLSVFNNQFEKLNLSGLGALQSLACQYNMLTELDLTGLTNLSYLYCSANMLTALDLTGLNSLTSLEAARNKIAGQLDLSGLKNLEKLILWDNELSEVVLGDHPNLKTIDLDNNRLTGKLDLSNLSSLESCSANYNELDELNLGNNQALTALYLYDNNLKSSVDLGTLDNLQVLNLAGNSLEELSFKKLDNLQVIQVDNNKLTGKFDLSDCERLTSISASSNKLSELVLAKHPDLTSIIMTGNDLEGIIDLSTCPALNSVYLNSNKLQGIVLENNPELSTLDISNNGTIAGTLDISGSPKLEYLGASNNRISNFKYAEHPLLTYLSLWKNALTHFHVEDFTAVRSCSYDNQVAELTIDTPNLNLKTLSPTGFDPARTSDWRAYWNDGSEKRSHECSMINNVLIIPEEAGRDVELTYSYLTDVTTNKKTSFTINLTREGFTAIDDVTADAIGDITVEGNIIHTATDSLKEVFNLNGQCIYRGTDESVHIDSGHGIYIIRIAGKVFKVAL